MDKSPKGLIAAAAQSTSQFLTTWRGKGLLLVFLVTTTVLSTCSPAEAQLSHLRNELWHQGSAWVDDALEPLDRFGASLAVGNFNGDEYMDLAIGIPDEDVGATLAAGAVQVLYGTAEGIEATDDQFLHQGLSIFQGAAEPIDHFGTALAVGDFNSDGFDDLVVGVPGEAIGYVAGAGAVHVIYGSSDGLSSDDEIWHQDDEGVPGACEEHDWLGSALAVGDFDNDGYDDLAVGAPYEDLSTTENAGWVGILYGGSAGLTATDSQSWHEDREDISGVGEKWDWFGDSLASGDFDADGYDDLAIGIPGQSFASAVYAGQVLILRGSGEGLVATGHQYWDKGSSGITDDHGGMDNFGDSLSSGDFNGDGYDDLVIGVPDEDHNGTPEAGAVHVLYGGIGGLSATGNQFWDESDESVPGNVGWYGHFGWSLATGDIDNDGYDDLAIGIPGKGIAGSQSGAATVLYGSLGGLSTDRAQLWAQDVAGIYNESEEDDVFGYAVAIGDFDNDGYGDLAVGVPGEDITTEGISEGAVHLLYGAQLFNLEVTMIGAGSGSVTSFPVGVDCGEDCSEALPVGTTITLTAQATQGSTFVEWIGGACAGGIVELQQDTTCTAFFDLQQHLLTVAKLGSGSGNVTSSPPGISCGADCTENFDRGTEVTLSPNPNPGSVFGGWSGDADCTDGVVTVSSAVSCTATYSLESYTLNVTKTGSGDGMVLSDPPGISCGGDCAAAYYYGAEVMLTPSPDAGSEFVGWSGYADCADGTVTVDTDLTCTAEFSSSTGPIFTDGFESSDLTKWSSYVQ